MNKELDKLSFLLIGSGIGVSIGRDDVWILIFGMGLITLGFIINYFNDRK